MLVVLSRKQPTPSQEVFALPVVGALVLQPLSVLLHRADLLAVVVGYGVTERLKRRVHTIPLDVLQKLTFSLQRTLALSNWVQVQTKLTSAICAMCFPFMSPNALLPSTGPANHPTAPQLSVASPNMMSGSIPIIICDGSISLLAR